MITFYKTIRASKPIKESESAGLISEEKINEDKKEKK